MTPPLEVLPEGRHELHPLMIGVARGLIVWRGAFHWHPLERRPCEPRRELRRLVSNGQGAPGAGVR